MKQALNLTYASSITNLHEINSSFDAGILRVAYTGRNRNGSSISKPVFEKCIKSIYNCPVVCHYDRDTDSLGGHDVEVVVSDGSPSLVNLTTPVGVIPESSRIFWEKVREEDGTINEYICAEALIWKRQEAYQKIKSEGCVAQSMEINVKDGEMVNGVYEIYDFEFTALALIGVTPCFESASLEFTKTDFKQQLSQMMLEIKDLYSKVITSNEEDIHPLINFTEGGETTLSNIEALIAEFGIDVSALDFSVDDFTEEELREKFAEIAAQNSDESEDEVAKETAEAEDAERVEGENAEGEESEVEAEKANEPDEPGDSESSFALESNCRHAIMEAVCGIETVEDTFGEYPRYYYEDYDKELQVVYCWDSEDGRLYGFNYDLNGDVVSINPETKKRKKYEIVDFEDGAQDGEVNPIFSMLIESREKYAEVNKELCSLKQSSEDMANELSQLREFKCAIESEKAEAERQSVFSQFEDLEGVEAYEELKSNCSDMDASTLEEKLFAIRGRNISRTFSLEEKAPKLVLEKTIIKEEPAYGGLFDKYLNK